MKRTSLKRRKPLTKRREGQLVPWKAIPRRQQKPMTVDDRMAAEAFRRKVCSSPCVVCGSTVDLKAHHVLPKREIKAYASANGLDAAQLRSLLWDPRNGLSLCERDHMRHERALVRVPLALIPAKAWQFARELGRDWLLERTYGREAA